MMFMVERWGWGWVVHAAYSSACFQRFSALAYGRRAAHGAPLLRQAPDPRTVLARLVALRPRRGRDAVVRGRNGREDQSENEGKSHEKLD